MKKRKELSQSSRSSFVRLANCWANRSRIVCTPRCLSTLSGMESGCLTRVMAMRRRTLEIWTDCWSWRKLLSSRWLTCSCSCRSISCHSACHVRRRAKRRLTSNDGSSCAVVIINLSLPMQKAKHPLRFCVGSLVWGRFFCWFGRTFDQLRGLGSAALCCLFLLGSLFCERLQVTDQSQFCWRLAFRLILFRTDQTFRCLPLS